MERSFKQRVFERGPALDFGPGKELRHGRKMMQLEHLLLDNVELVPCETSPGGKISIRNVCLKQPGIVSIDLELMNYLFFQIPGFFKHVARKSRIDLHQEFTVLCNGSTIYEAGIPALKVYLKYMPGKTKLDLTLIGKDYWGLLPPMYQLAYRLPNNDAYNAQLVA